jgi:hypothetical protein
MGTSAFELLIVPVVLGTLWGLAAGAAFLALMNAAEAVFALLSRAIRLFKASHRPARVSRHPAPRPVARGAARPGKSWVIPG